MRHNLLTQEQPAALEAREMLSSVMFDVVEEHVQFTDPDNSARFEEAAIHAVAGFDKLFEAESPYEISVLDTSVLSEQAGKFDNRDDEGLISINKARFNPDNYTLAESTRYLMHMGAGAMDIELRDGNSGETADWLSDSNGYGFGITVDEYTGVVNNTTLTNTVEVAGTESGLLNANPWQPNQYWL